MTAHRYYCERIIPGTIELAGDESHHAVNVLRVRLGDTIELFDGRGTVAAATVSRVARKAVSVEVTTVTAAVPRSSPALVLCVAVPKGPRQHVLVEKCTELGVALLQPILTERGVVEADASTVARWRRYAIEAGKQSHQAWLPDIPPRVGFIESLTGRTGVSAQPRLIASPAADAPPLAAALRGCGGVAALAVWIGPEGGFTPAELQAARAAGLQTVSLGDAVLRIETAAIAVAAAVRLR
jgi:16S rRNA (uracil1498-N3)-methyltransferase